MNLAAIEIPTDTLIAIIVTAIISGVVPTILLLVKIANDRAARIQERMDTLAEEAAETNFRSRTNRGNVEELWKERDDLHKEMATLNRALENHSRLLKAASPDSQRATVPESEADSS
jgi:uncharacterized membrane protein (DUF106 family)